MKAFYRELLDQQTFSDPSRITWVEWHNEAGPRAFPPPQSDTSQIEDTISVLLDQPGIMLSASVDIRRQEDGWCDPS